MQRFVPYLGIVAALLLVAFLMSFPGRVTVERRVANPTASSTLSIVSSFSLPVLSFPSLSPNESVATTTSVDTASVPKKKVIMPPTPVAPMSSIVPATKPIATPAPLMAFGNAAFDASASALRSALVNIICYAPAASGLHSISGSGVIIDSKGIILTNAHIAQYFLLLNRGISCTIRTGSPATNRYEASLIFISPAWIRKNASVITQSAPSGTGEHDFALLAIDRSTSTTPLPSSFPSLPLAETPPMSGTPVVIASYGAQFLESSQIQSSLFPTVVFGSVKEVFTFVANTIDVFSLGGSAAAQEGSSGGGVADASGSLIGTITTSTVEGATNTRNVDAITASYIRSDYASETGSAIDLLLATPTATSIVDFASDIPALRAILTAQLP